MSYSPPAPLRRHLATLTLLLTTASMVAVIACAPPRGGGGGDDCEDDTDCRRSEYCDIDTGDEEGECRDLDGGNNAGNNGDFNNILDNNGSNNAGNNTGTNNPPANNDNNPPANNDNNPPANNDNNPPANNDTGFTSQECFSFCDRAAACPDFEDCDTTDVNNFIDQCFTICESPEQRTLLAPYETSACNEIFDLVNEIGGDLTCDGPTNNGQTPEQFCADMCDNLFTCTASCSEEVISPDCESICLDNADPASDPELQRLSTDSCTNIRSEFCIEPNDVDAGATCTSNGSCDAGSLTPRCITDGEGWAGGYCTAECRAHTECGDTNVCLLFEEGADLGFCMQGCFSDDDCRSDYFCSDLNDTSIADGVCFPRCESNADCADTATCNLETGVCE